MTNAQDLLHLRCRKLKSTFPGDGIYPLMVCMARPPEFDSYARKCLISLT